MALELSELGRVLHVDFDSEFCTGDCEDRTGARQVEESPLLEAVASERLIKT
jgi:hypothetical protein